MGAYAICTEDNLCVEKNLKCSWNSSGFSEYDKGWITRYIDLIPGMMERFLFATHLWGPPSHLPYG